jgi:hypothetical protein
MEKTVLLSARDGKKTRDTPIKVHATTKAASRPRVCELWIVMNALAIPSFG